MKIVLKATVFYTIKKLDPEHTKKIGLRLQPQKLSSAPALQHCLQGTPPPYQKKTLNVIRT